MQHQSIFPFCLLVFLASFAGARCFSFVLTPAFYCSVCPSCSCFSLLFFSVTVLRSFSFSQSNCFPLFSILHTCISSSLSLTLQLALTHAVFVSFERSLSVSGLLVFFSVNLSLKHSKASFTLSFCLSLDLSSALSLVLSHSLSDPCVRMRVRVSLSLSLSPPRSR